MTISGIFQNFFLCVAEVILKCLLGAPLGCNDNGGYAGAFGKVHGLNNLAMLNFLVSLQDNPAHPVLVYKRLQPGAQFFQLNFLTLYIGMAGSVNGNDDVPVLSIVGILRHLWQSYGDP